MKIAPVSPYNLHSSCNRHLVRKPYGISSENPRQEHFKSSNIILRAVMHYVCMTTFLFLVLQKTDKMSFDTSMVYP